MKARGFLKIMVLFHFVFISCRKDVTLKLPDYNQKVVIEAAIETGSTAYVFLSYGVPYFGDFDYTTPETAFIKGAFVTVTDGLTIDTLQALDSSRGYLYFGFKLLGVEGRTYTIKVVVNGKTYTTQSTIISQPNALDSIYFQPERDDSLGYILQKFNEPKGSGDCYRWFAKRLGRDLLYAAPFNSVFDDKFIDGQIFEFGYDRGRQPNILEQNSEDPERGYYKKGDTVIVKFCKIGRREYDFWYTYYQNKLSNGNPFSSPANVKSMFDDYENCFGSFMAYSPRFDTLIIPK